MFRAGNNSTAFNGLNSFWGVDGARVEIGLVRFLPPVTTIYTDSFEIYVDIQVSSSELFAGTSYDAATVSVLITPSGTDDHDSNTTDAATVTVDIQVSGVDELTLDTIDAATIYVDLTVASHDCYFKWSPTWLGTKASNKWTGSVPVGHKWSGKVSNKWTATLGYGIEEEC